MFKEIIFGDKKFWKNVLLIVFPILMQNLSISLLALLDVSILKNLGEEAMGAVSLANKLNFIVSNMTFGVASGASIYMARYFGEGNGKKVSSVFSLTLTVSAGLNFLFFIIADVFPGAFMSVMTDKAALIALGKQYLYIYGPVFLMSAVTNSVNSLLRSSGKAHLVLISCFTSIGLKTALNYLFVLVFGFGVRGAALATLISKTAEVAAGLIIYRKAFGPDYRVSFKDFKEITAKKVGGFIKDTAAVICNESFWAIGIALFSVVFGRMRVEEIAALNVAQTLEELFNSLFYGVGIGATVIIGQNIGARNYAAARLNGKRFLALGIEVGLLILILMVSFNNIIVNTFFKGLSDVTVRIAKVLITEFALLMPFRASASAVIMGLMRAGGKQKQAMYYDVLPVYLWSLPVGLLLGLVFKLPIIIVLPAMYAKRIIKSALSLVTALRGRWYKKELIPEEI